MSLESQIERLALSLENLTSALSSLALPAAVEAPAPAVAPPATPEKKTRSKKETPPPVVVAEEIAAATTELTGLSDDDGFGDEGFGDEPAATITIEYKKHDAVTALKALRDVAVASKGAQEGMLIARKALDETGFGNVAHIEDADAEKCVDIAVRAAKAAGIVKELRDRALEMGVEL